MNIKESVEQAIKKLKEVNPLVHNITNSVVMEINANVLLAIGASPVMSTEGDEFEDMLSIASSLVVNIGTLEKISIDNMFKAVEIANKKNVPFVLDPVGVGATKLRTDTALELIKKGKPKIVRGNASEIMALAGANAQTKGVDSTASTNMALESAKVLAKNNNMVVSVSGETDIITDGDKVYYVDGGSKLMTYVTGCGCSATAVTGAMLGVSEPLVAGVSAMGIMASAGEKASKIANAPGSFKVALIDELYNLNINDIINRIRE